MNQKIKWSVDWIMFFPKFIKQISRRPQNRISLFTDYKPTWAQMRRLTFPYSLKDEKRIVQVVRFASRHEYARVKPNSAVIYQKFQSQKVWKVRRRNFSRVEFFDNVLWKSHKLIDILKWYQINCVIGIMFQQRFETPFWNRRRIVNSLQPTPPKHTRRFARAFINRQLVKKFPVLFANIKVGLPIIYGVQNIRMKSKALPPPFWRFADS